MDKFKLVNDTLGHMEGDRVLREVAQILRELTRSEDLVGRYAGDEFVIVCHDRGFEDVSRISERIRGGVLRYGLMGDDNPSLSVSIGAARFPMDGTDWRSFPPRATSRSRDKLHHQELDAGPISRRPRPILASAPQSGHPPSHTQNCRCPRSPRGVGNLWNNQVGRLGIGHSEPTHSS